MKDKQKRTLEFNGVIPVLETPFTSSHEVDRGGFERVLNHVLDAGVDGVMFPGYASEVLKLSDQERRELISSMLAVTSSRPLLAIVSVPDHATRLAVDSACWAAENGANAINVLPPYLLGPSTAQVVDHVRQILRAVAPLPVVVQYAPNQTNTSLRADDLISLAGEHPNLAAIKVESSPPGEMVSAIAGRTQNVLAWIGYAGLHLPEALRCGAAGVQPGCSFAELYVEIWRRWEANDVEGFDKLHGTLRPYLEQWMQHVELIVQVEKTISMRRGLIDTDVCRAPGFPLDERQRASVEAFMTEFEPWLTRR